MFLGMTPLKVGLQVGGFARARDDSPAKSTNGLLLGCNPVSSVGKPECFQIALFVLKLGSRSGRICSPSTSLYTHRQKVS